MSTNETTPNTTTDGREANGWFAPGNPGGPGNPYARQVAQVRCRALDSVSGDDVEAILAKLVALAKEGDVSAARAVLQYTLGRPVPYAHPDRIDRDEMEAFPANAMRQDTFSAIQATPVEPALMAMRELLPSRGQKFKDDLLANIQAQIAAEERAKAADSKRPKRAKSPPVSADPTVAFAEAETLRLIDPPEDDDGQTDRRAANPRRS